MLDERPTGSKVRNALVATALVLLGIFIGGLGALYLIAQQREPKKSEEQLRREYVVDYTKTEEERYGVRCKDFNTQLRAFLRTDIRAVLESRKVGQGWSARVSEDLRKKVVQYRDHYLLCGKLYVAGRNGEWNGLSHLGFTLELDKEIADLHIFVRFGEPKQGCNAKCLDQNFEDFRDVVTRIEARL